MQRATPFTLFNSQVLFYTGTVMADKVRAVGTIIENTMGEILLLKRHKNDPEGEAWGLVGGKIDDGESSIEAAVREIVEEIGLVVTVAELAKLKVYRWNRADLDIYFETFMLKFHRRQELFVLPQNEVTEYTWIDPKLAYQRNDLMQGLYPILADEYQVEENKG